MLRRQAVVHHGGRHHADAGVAMLVVVPGEKRLAEGAAVLDAAEAIRKLGAVLHGAELAFRIRIVVGSIGPAVGLGDAQIGQQKGHRLGAHGRAAVGVDGELAGGMLCFSQVSSMSLLGQFGAFARRHHPADDVAAEDVEDDVEVEVGPLGRAAQLGDVPTPKLVGRGGQQLRLLIRRMGELIAALARGAVLFQDAIHGARGAEILAFIEQGGLNGGRRAILEALRS